METRLRALVEALCSRECAGRAPGTAEGRAARARVVAALEAAGVNPAVPAWEQPIVATGGANVLGRVRGAGSDGRVLLIGAHYDHLGRDDHDVYWGADDNAAAVAILVELGRALAARPAQRDVWLCAFDGEEPPYFLTEEMGSEQFARRAPLPLERIDLMVCMDLVGHALGTPSLPATVRESLFVLGAEASSGTAALVDSLPEVAGVCPRRAGLHLLPPLSDYHPFEMRGVPTLFLTAGRWRYYHTPQDRPERLDYAKMAATARWLELLVRAAAAQTGPRVVLPDRDDAATVASLRALALALRGHWPGADAVLRRLGVLAAATSPSVQLTPTQFTELRMLLGLVEATLS